MSKHIQHTKASFSYTFEYKWVSYRNLKLKSRGQQYREKKKKRKYAKALVLVTRWRTKVFWFGWLFGVSLGKEEGLLFGLVCWGFVFFFSNPCLPMCHKKVWTINFTISLSSHCCCFTATKMLQLFSFSLALHTPAWQLLPQHCLRASTGFTESTARQGYDFSFSASSSARSSNCSKMNPTLMM